MRGDARYLAAKGRAEGDADLSKAAATLLASARQAGRDAWELASREAAARAEATPANPHEELARIFAAEQAAKEAKRRAADAAASQTADPAKEPAQ